jgi:succinyl-diaminopimelate desuccinylase
MISNTLLKFAASQNWHVANEDEYVFGKFHDYCITAKTDDVLTSFFTSIAGIAPEDLIELTTWLEQTRFPLKLVDYEMTDNFIAIRAKDTAFSGTAKQMETFLELFTDKLKALEVDPGLCVICGLPADELALYVGLYCHFHPDCIDKEGYDFTSIATEDDPESEKEDKESDELVMLTPMGDIPANEDDEVDESENDESGDRPDKERISTLAQEFSGDREQFLDDLRRLCAVPSVDGTPEDGAPFGRETKRVLEVFLDTASGMGFKTVNLGNVAGYVEMGKGNEMVAAVCHLDVVPAGSGWESDPFKLLIEGDKVTARGVNDNKGPCLATLYAMKALKDDADFSPKRRIRLIVGLNEEKGMACMKHYRDVEELPVAGFTPDAQFPAIYAEKGIASIALSQKRGVSDAISSARGGAAVNMVPSDVEVTLKEENEPRTYKGVSAHASTPHLGVNAISRAMEELDRELSEKGLTDRFVTAYRALIGQELDGQSLGLAYSDETGDTTVNAGLLHIDEIEARVTINIRYPVSFDVDAAKERLRNNADAFDVKAEWISVVEPLHLPKDSHLISTLMNVYNEATGLSGEALAIGGGTYARSLPNICGFGPAFPGDPDVPHQANEWMSVDSLLAGAVIYREALRRLAD